MISGGGAKDLPFNDFTSVSCCGLEKTLLLSIRGDERKIPSELQNVSGFKTRKGITNPAVIVNEDEITALARLIFVDAKGDNSAIVKYDGRYINGKPLLFRETERVVFSPNSGFGKRGVEDFRGARIDGEIPYHGFMVHHDGKDARTEYLRTTARDPFDLTKWESHGIWFPNISAKNAIGLVKEKRYQSWWEKAHRNCTYLGTKDCSLWPEKIKRKTRNGEEEFYGVITRLLPDMQIVYIKDFNELAREEFWYGIVRNIGDHLLLSQKYGWEESHIGLAGQPVITKKGVLIFYHGAVMNPERIYRFGAALADRKNPQKIIARTREPILEPTEPWELRGGVVSGRVVFPTAHILRGDTIEHFYGASDECVGHCVTSIDYIFNKMESV